MLRAKMLREGILQLVFGLPPGSQLAPSTAEAAFRALDGDKNGALSPTELATGMAEGRAPPSRIVEQAEDILSTLLDAPTNNIGVPAYRSDRSAVGNADVHTRAGTASVPLATFLRFLAPLESPAMPTAAVDMDTDDAAGDGQWTVGCDSRFITAHTAKLLGCKRAKGRKGKGDRDSFF